MKHLIPTALLVCLLTAGCENGEVRVPHPPGNHTVDVRDTLHGSVIADPYRWLETDHSGETRDWIARQNHYCDTILQQVHGRAELHKLLSELLVTDRLGCPIEAGGRYFYVRYRSSEELPVLCVREGLDAPERVLVDPHTMRPDHSVSVEFMDIANDGSMISYAVRESGMDETQIRFLDVESGRDYPEILPTGRYLSLEFSRDRSAVYYVRHDASGPRLYYHRLRSGMIHDRELFGGHLKANHLLYVQLSDNGRWLMLSVVNGHGGPVGLYLADLEKELRFIPVVDDGKSRHYARFAGDMLIILTDRGAPRRRVMATSCLAPRVDNWVEVIPQPRDAVIQDVVPAGGMLLLRLLRDAQFTAALYRLDGTRVHTIDLGTMGSILTPTGNWDSGSAFVMFTSFHIPRTVYRIDVQTGRVTEWYRSPMPVETGNVVTRRVRYRSNDGTEIPMFLLHRQGLQRDGSAPALLFGYGMFGASFVPSFDALATAIVNAGGVLAIPNIRGGGEFGETWHAAGRGANKQQTFDDFIAAAEYLVRERYTTPRRLGVYGGGHAGLLVGVCVTRRPDLFGAAVCRYPLLDMLRYHRFRAGAMWTEEYGSSDDSLDFRTLRSYSPYHNVRSGVPYPAVLFVTGDADTRFDAMHARKMTARLQAANGGAAPVLLRNQRESGAVGERSMSRIIDDLVDVFSFLAWRLDLRISTGT